MSSVPTIKEQLVDIIRGEGFDFMTACGHADEIIRRVSAAVVPVTYSIGSTDITVSRVAS